MNGLLEMLLNSSIEMPRLIVISAPETVFIHPTSSICQVVYQVLRLDMSTI